MRLTYSIFAAAAFCSLSVQVGAADNFSLWPRRPDELEQARRLMQEQKGGEAVLLLQPFVTDDGIAGREARQICGRVNVPRYLSRLHPAAKVYTVRSGDNMARIAAQQKCPQDVIMMLNGIVEPSSLRVGQKLVLIPMRLRVEIRPIQREVSVWDGQQLVADYPIIGMDEVPAGERRNEVTRVAAREGYINGLAVLPRSPQYPASERVVVLENGMALAGETNGHGAHVLRLEQKDANELALMLGIGNEVKLIYPVR